MAWLCVRCEQKIYYPRPESIRHVVEWKYSRRLDHVSVNVKNLNEVKDGATITHLSCDRPEEQDFDGRMKKSLKIPANKRHPLLM